MSDDFFPVQPEWSMARHTLIGEVADRLLSQNVRNEVRTILTPGESSTLGEVADWPDQLKSNPPSDPETQAFLNDPENRDTHRRWHYVDLPFGAAAYDPVALEKFIPPDGAHVVAKAIECALAVVTPTPRLSRTNALRWIAHLIGDMHQPMHLGCGYIDASHQPPRLVGDPQAAQDLPSDHGGNNLQLPPPLANTNLHSYWDDKLASVSLDSLTHAAQAMETPVVARDTVEPAIVSWVEDTLVACKDAYATVRIDQVLHGDSAKFRIAFDQGLAAYVQRNEPHVTRQMARAAVRLAALVTALVS